MKFFLKCNEAAHVCDKSQYNEASFFEKFKLKMHILMCVLCRRHVKRNIKLTKTIKSANIKTLHPDEKQLLKTRLQHEANNAQES
ncbi:hypothetical protein ESU54_04630 [Aequorivita antarctica]|uniref:Glycine dehydrogenase n=1 Tax=Aequorivita antarctica TaxID=153266 RepID=A0A5C6Z1D7_9FLAO|nr:hypothetical protein ESU54_04630 [Aequorivita antarctica]